MGERCGRCEGIENKERILTAQRIAVTILLFISGVICFPSLVSGENVGIILTPAPGTSCYNSSFYQVAKTISNLSSFYLVEFNCTDMTQLKDQLSNFSEHTPIYIVIQPSNLTPSFLENIFTNLSSIDNDPFLDFPYGIITAVTNSTAVDFFTRNVTVFDPSKLYISCVPESCTPLGGFIHSLYASSSYDALENATAPKFTVKTVSQGFRWLVLCSNTSAGNLIPMANGTSIIINSTGWYASEGGVINLKSSFFAVLASYSGRFAGNSSSPYDLGANPYISFASSPPVVFAKEGADYLGLHSSKIAGLESIFNLFFSDLFTGSSFLESSEHFRNYIMLMKATQPGVNSNFLDYLASSLVLEGKDFKIPSEHLRNRNYGVSLVERRQLNSTIPIGEPIWWEDRINVTVQNRERLLSCDAGVCRITASAPFTSPWIVNATRSGGSVNITFLAGAFGHFVPQSSTINIIEANSTADNTTMKAFIMTSNETTYDVVGNTSLVTKNFVIGKNNNTVYFAELYSPNETLQTTSHVLDLVYITAGISMKTSGAECMGNRTEVKIDLENPTSSTVENVTFNYTLPELSTFMNISGGSATPTNNTLNVALANLDPGEKVLTIIYTSNLSLRDHAFSRTSRVYNRGENVSFNASFKINADLLQPLNFTVRAMAISPSGTIFWKNTTTYSSSQWINLSYTLTVGENHPDGRNLLIIEIYDNATGLPLLNYSFEFNTTSKLKLISVGGVDNVVTFNKTSHIQNLSKEWFFNMTDSIFLTGTVNNFNNESIVGAMVNISLIRGENGALIASTSTNTTSGGIYNATLSWQTDYAGEANLKICAHDNFNNSACYTRKIYITTFIENSSASFNITRSNHGLYIFNDEDKIFVIVDAWGGNKTPVYGADVKLEAPSVTTSGSVTSATTDSDGEATLVLIPWSESGTYTLNISITDPLNTSKKYYHTLTFTILDIKRWKYNGNSRTIIYKQEPSTALVDHAVELYGNITLNGGNPKWIVSRTINHIKLMAGGSDVTKLSSCRIADYPSSSDPTFRIKCVPKVKEEHCLYLNVSANYDGRVIYEYNIPYCFNVKENTTTSKPAQHPSKQRNKGIIKTCKSNDDCETGEHCSNGFCEPLKCGADEVIYDHMCVRPNELYKLELVVPKLLIKRNSKSTYTITVKNEGMKPLRYVSIHISSKALNFNGWYVFRGSNTVSVLSPHTSHNFTVEFRALPSMAIGEYPLVIKAISKDGATAMVSTNLKVVPNEEDVQKLKHSFETIKANLTKLREDIIELLKSRNTTELRIAKLKVEKAMEIFNASVQLFQKGDYFSAYQKMKEVTRLLESANDLYIKEKEAHEKAQKFKRTIITILTILGIGAGIFYYLWIPPKVEVRPVYSYSGDRGRIEIFEKIEDTVRKFKESIKKWISKKKGEKPRYNYHRRRRWRF